MRFRHLALLAGLLPSLAVAQDVSLPPGLRSGGSGDVSGMSATMNSGASPGTLSRLFADRPAVIATSRTLTVPGSYATLSAAVDALRASRIDPSATVTIQIADGTYTFASAIDATHPDGDRIRIVGNTATPANVVLQWAGSTDGIYVGQGGKLGLLNGVTIKQTNAAARGAGSGILADRGGTILCGPNVVVDGFYYGYQARRRGYIEATGTIGRNGGDTNYFAFLGGTIYADGTASTGANDSANNFGFGYVAEYGGTIWASNATASANYLHGFYALSGGSIRADGSTATSSIAGSGFAADTSGSMTAHGGVAFGNARYGSEVRDVSAAVQAIPAITQGAGAANTLGLAYGDAPIGRNITLNGPGPTVYFNSPNRIRSPATNTLEVITGGVSMFRFEPNGTTRSIGLSADPTANLVEGQTYWNTATKRYRVYDGTAWGDMRGAN